MKHRITSGIFTALLFLIITTYAQDYLEIGRAARHKGDIDLAISSFLRAYEQSPHSTEVNFELGDAYYEKGILDSAEIYLRGAIKYDDENTKASVRLGALLSDTKRSSEAIVYFRNALKLSKNDFDAMLGLGLAYIDVDSTDAANLTLEKAKLLNEKSALPYVGLGRVWEKQRVWNYAIDLYLKAIQLDSKNVEPHVALANIYLKTRKFPEAIKELQDVITLDPANANAYDKAGRVYLAAAQSQSGNTRFYVNAIEMFAKFVELRPTNLEGWISLGKSYYGNKDFAKAADAFQHALQVNPNSVEAHRLAGYAYYFGKEYSKAVESLNWIINSSPGTKAASSDDHYRLAVSYFGLKDTVNAIIHYETAVTDTTQIEAMNELARIYMAQGNFDKAVKTFDRYIALNPNNPAAYYNIGITLMSMRRYSDAINYFRHGSELNPDFLQFYINIGSCQANNQDYSEAIKTYESALNRIESAPQGKYKNSDIGDVYYYYGGVLLVSQRYSSAMQTFLKALRYRKDDTQIHILYGQAAVFSFDRTKEDELRRKAEDATRHLRQALVLEPNNTEAMFWLAQILIQSRVTGEFPENKKKTAEAIDLLKRAKQLNPRDSKIQKFLDSLVG
ncbi:MAG: tetratricopeptide repeat protein [Bacteroidota bacterium]